MKTLLFHLIFISIALTINSSGDLLDSQPGKTKAEKNVSLKELISNPGKYHGQKIKTQGYFVSRFEERAVYIDRISSTRTPSNAIWIYFSAKSKRSINFESLSTKSVTLKGTVDISIRGHVGAYVCSLFNADLLSSK